MKKILICVMVIAMTLSMVACSNDKGATTDPTAVPTTEPTTEPTAEPTQQPTTEPTQEPEQEASPLEETMENIYSGLKDTELPMLNNTVVTDENVEYFLGTKDVSYTHALASEPMINAIAHSVVLIQVEDDGDIESIKTKIKENVDGRKWICVGVEDDKIIVDNIDNLIILIVAENSEAIHESFKALAK